ncbi:hypothetical protein CONPUDRAFT_136957 [Coniophora puteana RWD-64-598 SS2]|uniref:Uncharacterized protein n=1 Tax=Coniophora puteana (strain RWD-64-598) TaxID=741705 RepID=A0A5M3MTI1_CONPW|nr:uncharacterized protein CONPUDRAFT_136957 [Coniophora puteana RWD-64-598 SS2]EIW82463.1 hypothetical protein CONPUDRAFT_136957 [Coniophora puteana RWD-64-598 SS2]
MNSDTNDINDATKVRTLLEQLRSSEAWQATIANPTQPKPPSSCSSEAPSSATRGQESVSSHSSTSPIPSVASLLSQLTSTDSRHHASTSAPFSASADVPSGWPSLDAEASFHPYIPPATVDRGSQGDVKTLTFQQALPILTKLGEDPAFILSLKQLKEKQNQLERRLWDERQAIEKKYQDKVAVTQRKTELIGGGGVSKHDAEMLNSAYRMELKRFEEERIVNAWDSLVAEQQFTLEAAGVPTIFGTDSKTELEKQRNVMQVLDALIG